MAIITSNAHASMHRSIYVAYSVPEFIMHTRTDEWKQWQQPLTELEMLIFSLQPSALYNKRSGSTYSVCE